MDSIMIWILAGALAVTLIILYFLLRRKKIHTKEEATILLERVKKVCKLVTIEGHFVEVFDHTEEKHVFFGLIPQKKKALMIVKGKAFVGMDLAKAEFEIHNQVKTIRIKKLPTPEVIGVETDIQFYDLQQSMFNKFDPDGYTQLNRKANMKLKEQVMQSGLLKQVSEQAEERLHLIGSIAETIGWKLEVSKKALI